MDTAHTDGPGRSRLANLGPPDDDDLLPGELVGDPLFLAEVAAVLAQWPVRNQVVRAALDRARDELLRLAQDAGPKGDS
jgi:hypothetical protein